MRRAVVLAAAALAIVLCGGCRDQAQSPDQGPSQGSGQDSGQFEQVESTLASIEADVNQP